MTLHTKSRSHNTPTTPSLSVTCSAYHTWSSPEAGYIAPVLFLLTQEVCAICLAALYKQYACSTSCMAKCLPQSILVHYYLESFWSTAYLVDCHKKPALSFVYGVSMLAFFPRQYASVPVSLISHQLLPFWPCAHWTDVRISWRVHLLQVSVLALYL